MALRRLWRSFSLRHLAAIEFRAPPTSPPTLSSIDGALPFFRRSGQYFAFSSPVGILDSRSSSRAFSSQAWVDVPAGDVVEVPLAQTGEGIAECELLKWFVNEGDQVEEFEPLCEVQSDKATIEITSRYKGKILQMLYVPGDLVKVGETLLKMLVDNAASSSTSNFNENNMTSSHKSCKSETQISPTNAETAGGVLSTPAVRNLAKQYGININGIEGTGKDGRVLNEDVLRYAACDANCNKPTLHDENDNVFELLKGRKAFDIDTTDDQFLEDKVVPLRGFQRSMVRSMTLAAKVPHFYYLEEIHCNAILELKTSFQRENTDPNVKHTFLPFLVKSLSMALSKFPLMNSSFNEESNEIILKGCHNIGVAVATPYGLVVPNIKKVQSLSILEVTKELARLQQLALNNKLTTEDISGGTITLSNIGAIGGKFGSPILNLPEVAIIAMGRIQKLPQFDDDNNVYPASVANVSIGADHRIIDGATVARFCNEWKHFIEKPELLLLHMR